MTSLTHVTKIKLAISGRRSARIMMTILLSYVSGFVNLMDHTRCARPMISSGFVSQGSGKGEETGIHISSDYPLGPDPFFTLLPNPWPP
ncbi:hypothetical protein VTN49DRAFT_749 [Thermomyces lanuginosus]|uniref:uncharacterized protein n=1 Tax=Thermomyces lanuginosus TaxID=5541 RepID=UPI00374298D3